MKEKFTYKKAGVNIKVADATKKAMGKSLETTNKQVLNKLGDKLNELEIAEKLWDLLDDIDTASDMFKPEKTPFYKHVMKKVQERFKYFKSPDGQKLILSETMKIDKETKEEKKACEYEGYEDIPQKFLDYGVKLEKHFNEYVDAAEKFSDTISEITTLATTTEEKLLATKFIYLAITTELWLSKELITLRDRNNILTGITETVNRGIEKIKELDEISEKYQKKTKLKR